MSSQLYELKMFISKLLKDREIIGRDKVKLRKTVAVNESELRILRDGIARMKKEMALMSVENDFYRQNFK